MFTFVMVVKYNLNARVIDKKCLKYYNNGEIRESFPRFYSED